MGSQGPPLVDAWGHSLLKFPSLNPKVFDGTEETSPLPSDGILHCTFMPPLFYSYSFLLQKH